MLKGSLWSGSSHSQTSILNTAPHWLPFCCEWGSQECCNHRGDNYKARETSVPCNLINAGISEFNFINIFFFERNFISNFFHHTECESMQQVTVRNLIPLPTAILWNVFSLLISSFSIKHCSIDWRRLMTVSFYACMQCTSSALYYCTSM